MTAIYETAYPRIRSDLSDKDLDELYTPTPDDLAFIERSTKSSVAAFGGLVLLKTFQRLGYFPSFRGLPPRLIQHLASAMGMLLPYDALERYEQRRLRESHMPQIRNHLGITVFSDGGRRVLVGSLLDAAQSKDILADLINVGIEALVKARYERIGIPKHFFPPILGPHLARTAPGTPSRPVMSANDIRTIEDLREVYGFPPDNSVAVRIVLPSLHKHHQAFIALSPFVIIASADAQGMPDVSPKGDLPGFVVAPDEHTLIIPDRPGNKKLLTLSNIVENPHVSLIFFIPGRTDTLRVNGKARLTTDPTVLAQFAVQGKTPQSALVVSVDLAWFHCGKAFIRSQLWEQDAQVAPDALPTLGQMCADQIKDDFDAAAYDQRQQGYAAARHDRSIESPLWGEPQS